MYDFADVMTGLVVLRGKSAMQLYARNMMVVTAASAVLAAGVLAAAPVEVSAGPVGLRTVSAPVELTTGVADCLAYGVCGIYDVAQVALAVPAYAVTYAAILSADLFEVVGAAVAYGATVVTAVVMDVAMEVASNVLATAGLVEIETAPTVIEAKTRLDNARQALKNDAAMAFSPANFREWANGLVAPAVPPTASLAPRARAASLPPRQSPSAKAAAASVKPASQARATRSAPHRTVRAGVGANW